MGLIPYLVVYFCLAVFIVAVIVRFFKWSSMPMHVRWELYPVAHEGKRASYGGSYLENSKWWEKKREVSLIGELKVMVPEILFLVALREHNKKLWTWSFPFHFGLYLVAMTTVLLMVGGLLMGLGWLPTIAALIGKVVPVIGGVGLALGIVGAFGLFMRRRGRELRDYTAPADILNLLLFIVVFGVAGSALVLDPSFSIVLTFVGNLVTFSMAPIEATSLAVTMTLVSAILLALLTAYIPLTHMSHFIGKYFAYHAIRWNDTPNLRGGDQEETIHKLLNQPLSWSASHIQGDGKKTWLEAATEDFKK